MPDRGNPDEPSRPRVSNRLFVASLLVLLVVATLLRMPGLTAGLPYSSYIDEGHYLHPTAHMIAHDTYDGGTYQNPYEHPSLPYDLIALSAEIYRLTGDTGIKAGAAATDASPYYDLMQPSELILIGRLVILVFSVGTVLLTVLLGASLIGRRGGLLAGLLVSFLPVLVSRSAVVTADPIVTFFALATLLVACRVARPASSRGDLGWAALGGAMAGLAFTSKYPAGAVLLAVLTVIGLRRDLTPRRRVGLAAAAGGASIVAAVISMPALVLDSGQVVTDVKYEASVYGSYFDGHYATWLVDNAQIGWLFAVTAAVGLVLLLRQPSTRRMAIGFLVFAVPYVGYLASRYFQPVRNLMPLLPFLAVAAAATLEEAMRALARLVPLDRRARAAGSLALAAVLIVTMFFAGVQPYLRRTDIVDSRTEAIDWLEQNVGPDDTVLVVEELAFMPADLDRIAGRVTVAPARPTKDAPRGTLAADPPDLLDYDYVVTPWFATGPYLSGTPIWTPPGSPLPTATFGFRATVANPNTWRTSDQVVSIYRNP